MHMIIYQTETSIGFANKTLRDRVVKESWDKIFRWIGLSIPEKYVHQILAQEKKQMSEILFELLHQHPDLIHYSN